MYQLVRVCVLLLWHCGRSFLIVHRTVAFAELFADAGGPNLFESSESSPLRVRAVRVAQKAPAIEKSERNSERVAIFTLLIAAAASIHHHDHDTRPTCSSKRVPIGNTGSVTNLEVGRNHSTSETVADRRQKIGSAAELHCKCI